MLESYVGNKSSFDIVVRVVVVVVVVVVVIAGIVVIIIVVVVVLVGVYGMGLGGLIGASQCRVIVENGLDLTSIC